MKLKMILAALLALLSGAAAADTLKDKLVGAWDFVIAEVKAPDGTTSLPFGDRPKGTIIFTADGRFAQIHVATARSSSIRIRTLRVDEEARVIFINEESRSEKGSNAKSFFMILL